MSPRPPHVLLTDYAWADVELERAILAAAGAELVVAPAGDEETLVQLAAQHDVSAILTCWARVTARVIAAAPRCRHVARLGIGLDNIDLDACGARGIRVCPATGANAESVAVSRPMRRIYRRAQVSRSGCSAAAGSRPRCEGRRSQSFLLGTVRGESRPVRG